MLTAYSAASVLPHAQSRDFNMHLLYICIQYIVRTSDVKYSVHLILSFESWMKYFSIGLETNIKQS